MRKGTVNFTRNDVFPKTYEEIKMRNYLIMHGTRKFKVSASNNAEARRKAVAFFGVRTGISAVCID